MHKNRNGYFWIFFIVLLFIISYMGYFLADKFYLWNSFIGIIISGLLFFVAIIPFTAYVAAIITKFTAEQDLHKKRLFKLWMGIIIAIPFALLSITVYSEYGEKNLNNALNLDLANVESLEFHLDGNSNVWQTKKDDAAKELVDFLSHYSVKKINEREWNSDVSKEIGFMLTVFKKNDIVMTSIYESRLVLYSDGDYYSVINGPIDMEWIATYNEKYEYE